MLKLNYFLIILVFALSVSVTRTFAQDDPKKKEKAYLDFIYNKTPEKKILKAKLKAKDEEGKFINIKDAALLFSMKNDTSEKEIAEVITDENGEALLYIDNNAKLLTDTAGICVFLVSFDGNDTVKSKEAELEVIDIDLSIDFKIVDSLKTVIVKGNVLKGNGVSFPVNSTEIIIKVQRMFSRLKLGTCEMTDGYAEFVFPEDIPGDSIGNLNVYAQVEENELFANAETSGKINWGVPVTVRDSYVQQFSGTSYIVFWIVSICIALALFIIFGRKKNDKA